MPEQPPKPQRYPGDPKDVRKGQVTSPLPRDAFRQRFLARFTDPAYRQEDAALDRLERIAWDAYEQGRKAPRKHKAGPGYADPDYELSDEWRAASDAIAAAQRRQADPATASRVLLVCAAARNDYTCPGEMSKSWRLAERARQQLEADGMEVDVLDLSHLASDAELRIFPCKGCVSTSMPLCHWPCSCYPNHALGQVNDWMNDIYPRWAGWCAPTVAIPIRPRRRARMWCAPSRWSWRVGTTPSTWRDAPTGWWCTATWRASKACAARCPTGSTGWG